MLRLPTALVTNIFAISLLVYGRKKREGDVILARSTDILLLCSHGC